MEEQLKRVIAASLGVDLDKVHPAARLLDMGDSLDALEMIMDVEEEFGIAIGDAEFEQCQTVGDLISLVVTR